MLPMTKHEEQGPAKRKLDLCELYSLHEGSSDSTK